MLEPNGMGLSQISRTPFTPSSWPIRAASRYEREQMPFVSRIDMEEGELHVDFDGRDVNFAIGSLGSYKGISTPGSRKIRSPRTANLQAVNRPTVLSLIRVWDPRVYQPHAKRHSSRAGRTAADARHPRSGPSATKSSASAKDYGDDPYNTHWVNPL
jgi:hypothetical protein